MAPEVIQNSDGYNEKVKICVTELLLNPCFVNMCLSCSDYENISEFSI